MTDITVIGWLIAIGLLAVVILVFYLSRPFGPASASRRSASSNDSGSGATYAGVASGNDNCGPNDSCCDAGGGGDGGG